MKKLATLLLAAGMVVASTAPANAVDTKIDFRYRTSFSTGSDFTGANSEDMRHRIRLGLTLAASENLSAHMQFQINHGNQWGNTGKHGDNNITAREMYMDWTVPGTAVKVRMGRHALGLPADAFGNNSVLGAGYGNREGVVVTAPVTDWLGVTGIWTRLAVSGTDLDTNNTDDMYALAANLKFDGFSGAVYAAYATLDDKPASASDASIDPNEKHDTDPKAPEFLFTAAKAAQANGWNGGRPSGSGNAYWVGATATFSAFDPFTLKVSAAFGEFDADVAKNSDRGWNVQAKASYQTAFGTPVLGAWYVSGEDKDGKGYMPNAGYFNGTNHFYDGFASLTNSPANTNNYGTWAVQAGIEGVSFLAGLTHDFHVTYMEGTNENTKAADFYTKDGAYNGKMTEDDSVVEISLNNVYKIYKNLAARLELAYIINDFDDAAKVDGKAMSEDDWYAGLTFDYRF